MADENPAASSPAEIPDPADTVAAATESVETTDTPQPDESAPSTTEESSEPESSGETAPESDSGETTTREPKAAERRIKQLNARLKEARERLSAYERQQRPEAASPIAAPVKPKLENYDSYDAYDQARDQYFEQLTSYRTAMAIRQEREYQAEALRETATREINEALTSAWHERVKDTQARVKSFDPAAAVHRVAPNPALDHFLLRSEVGPDVLDHLARNPREAERFRQYDPHETYVEAVKLELQVRQHLNGRQPASKTKPPAYVKGSGAAPGKPVYLEDLLYPDKDK